MVSKEQFISDALKARKAKKAKEERRKIDVDSFLIGNRATRNAKWRYNNKLLLHK